MKIITRFFTLMLMVILAITGKSHAATFTIQVTNNSFSPSSLTINSGDVVRFQWVAGVHTTAADNGAWPTLPLDASNQVQTLNLAPGTYPYHCTFHGAAGGIGMAGTIVVRNVSGVNDQLIKTGFNAYPNPSGGETTILLNIVGRDNYKIGITNAIGKTIKVIEVPADLAEQKIKVDLRSLPSGYYFYSLIANDKMIETRRLLLQH
jgi:plastocyanin